MGYRIGNPLTDDIQSDCFASKMQKKLLSKPVLMMPYGVFGIVRPAFGYLLHFVDLFFVEVM